MTIRIMKQKWIRACPFYIFDISHYREDGSCKCDDAMERIKMRRDWGYRAADFKRADAAGKKVKP